MHVVVCESSEVGAWAADYVMQQIRAFQPQRDCPFVLGLPTGSTPLTMYQHLIQAHRAGQISFEHVVSFNLDEYVGLGPDHPQSYHRYMRREFLNHVDLRAENVCLLAGDAPDLLAECQRYEAEILNRGGLTLCIGGVGEAGHVAFNEAGADFAARTHVQRLDASTRRANARFFEDDPEQVPAFALTLGMGTILAAQEVMILAQGDRKALAVYHAIEGEVTPLWPVSGLRQHPRSRLVCDRAAASQLTQRC